MAWMQLLGAIDVPLTATAFSDMHDPLHAGTQLESAIALIAPFGWASTSGRLGFSARSAAGSNERVIMKSRLRRMFARVAVIIGRFPLKNENRAGLLASFYQESGENATKMPVCEKWLKLWTKTCRKTVMEYSNGS